MFCNCVCCVCSDAVQLISRALYHLNDSVEYEEARYISQCSFYSRTLMADSLLPWVSGVSTFMGFNVFGAVGTPVGLISGAPLVPRSLTLTLADDSLLDDGYR